MKFLKLFEQKSYEEEVAEVCQKYKIENWSINSEGLVDVYGDVNLYECELIKLPLSFGYIWGFFSCGGNELTNLDGCPHTVSGYFSCWDNELTSLENCPQEVGGDFLCHYNQLTSLEGAPHTVANLYCSSNQLTSLRFAPEVEGEVSILPNPISDIPKKYLTNEYLQFIVKEQYDWNLYRKDGSMRLDRLEQMIEWGIETNKIKSL
jgi:hypothetical protein